MGRLEKITSRSREKRDLNERLQNWTIRNPYPKDDAIINAAPYFFQQSVGLSEPVGIVIDIEQLKQWIAKADTNSPKWDKMVCYQGSTPNGELQPAIYFYDSTSVNGLAIPVDIDEPGSGGGPGSTANSTPPPVAPPPLG